MLSNKTRIALKDIKPGISFFCFIFDKIKKPFHSWVITLWQFELSVKKRSLIADASCNYQILFYSALLLPSLLFALSMKLDNGRSDKLQVWPRSLLSVSHSICHFHFPFRFNRMSKAADSATLPPALLLFLSPCLSLSLLLLHFFFGATVKGRLFTWQIARNSFHYHASIVASSSLFDGLFPRPLIFYALCVYAPLHTMVEAEKNGGPTGRPCRPWCCQPDVPFAQAVLSRGHAHQHRPRELNVH